MQMLHTIRILQPLSANLVTTLYAARNVTYRLGFVAVWTCSCNMDLLMVY